MVAERSSGDGYTAPTYEEKLKRRIEGAKRLDRQAREHLEANDLPVLTTAKRILIARRVAAALIADAEAYEENVANGIMPDHSLRCAESNRRVAEQQLREAEELEASTATDTHVA